MIALPALDRAQQAAVDHPLDSRLVAIVGPSGTGKTVTLALRAARARAALRPGEFAIVTAPAAPGVARLCDALGAGAGPPLECAALGEIAFGMLREHRFDTGGSADLDLIDDVRAAEIFERAGARLFSLDWNEFVSAEVDPEITGMRAPERFAAAAFRLIRKLRMADMSPDAFVQAGLRGATTFYGRPPNFASVDVVQQTPERYRDSLLVDRAELARQHEREVDLVKIVGRLYRTYVDSLVAAGCLTRIDALVEVKHLFARRDDIRAACAARARLCFVDNAQDLNSAELGFLRALFGEGLERVTLAGDPQQRTLGFSGPRAEGILERAAVAFALDVQHRSAPGILAAARRILEPGGPAHAAPEVVVHRAETMAQEAHYVARRVGEAIAAGTPPSEVAVILRSLRCAGAYVEALLERDIPVDPAGEGSLYDFAPVQDALAALWALADPYRHDWLQRNLEAPWLRFSDATIATLCGEPAETQVLLFDVPGEAEDERGRRWDRRRDLRLARNLVRGDRDSELTQAVRERLCAFRDARGRWAELERRVDLGRLARAVFADTVLASLPGGARERFAAGLVERLAREVERFAERQPRATLLDFLLHAQHVAAADGDLLAVAPLDAGAVALRGVEAAKGSEFSHVFVVDVRAGAFPRYYVPDAFLFTPKHGMIAKENVGDSAVAARTAKFTYLQFKLGLRDRYNAEERRAFCCAATRARERLCVTASGNATRGVAAPELLEELRAAAGS